jgi:hypothetical protein
MRLFLTIIALFSISFSALCSNLEMINGKWDCSETSDEDGYISIIELIEDYDSENHSFTAKGTIAVNYEGVYLFKLKFDSYGKFSLDNDLFAPKFDDINIELMSGDMSKNEISQFKQELFDDNSTFKIVKINESVWVNLDLADNIESECKKI